MSISDDYREIARCLRSFKLKNRKEPKLNELYQIAGLNIENFNNAIKLGIQDNYFIFDKMTNTIREGIMIENEPTPPEILNASSKYPVIGFTPQNQALWEKILVGVFSVGLVFFLMYVALTPKDLTDQKWRIIHLFASLDAAALGAFLPGMFEVKGERSGLMIRATGSLAAFVFVFWLF